MRSVVAEGLADEAPGQAGLRLSFRMPYDWVRLLAFFDLRATPGVECVVGAAYLRSVSLDGEHGLLEVTHDQRRQLLAATLHGAPGCSLAGAGNRLRAMFDADAPAGDIDAMLGRDRLLRPLVRRTPGIRVPGAWDGFELTVRAILGQQVSVKAATTLAGRIAARYGTPLPPSARHRLSGVSGGGRGVSRVFPGPERLRRARFNNIGIVGSRAETIRRVAAAVSTGEVSFDPAQDPQDFRRAISTIKGIGDWTAHYVAMRVLKHGDAFPATDLGLLKSRVFPEPATAVQLLKRAEGWRPWRAYAAMHLWAAPGGSGG